MFDDDLVLFLHYAGNGTNASFETTHDPDLARHQIGWAILHCDGGTLRRSGG